MINEENSKQGGGRQIRSPEHLRAFAQEYYSQDFPKAENEGCIGPEAIKSLIQSGALPDDDVRQHLFGCSNCFVRYRETMATHKPAHHLSSTPWWAPSFPSFRLNPARSLAAAAFLALITVSFGLIFYSLRSDSRSPSVAQNLTGQLTGGADTKQDPAVNSGAEPGAPSTAKPLGAGKRTKSQPQIPGRRPKDPVTTITISIDLREDVLRAAEEPQSREEKFIELPPSRATLLFHLPDGSDRGVYEIKIVDPFGSPLKRAKGFSHDGKTLRVLLDLRGMSETRYRLCLSRKGEAPDCYQIFITNGLVKS